ncbi:MAG: hypothetical protein WEA56_12535 [Balneolaceae bacterium]
MKLHKLSAEATLQQITSFHRPAAELLNSIGLDISGQTDKTLRQICAERKWNEVELLEWIKKSEAQPAEEHEYRNDSENLSGCTISGICDLLAGETHPRIESYLSFIKENYSRVSKVHGNQTLWLKKAAWHIDLLAEKLQVFRQFEREKLFPLSARLQKLNERILYGDLQNLKRSISVIEKDHTAFINLMSTIRSISSDFYFDEAACSTTRILCKRFKDLFSQLDEHISIERKVLLPKIKEMIRES